MKTLKHVTIALSITLLSVKSFAQQTELDGTTNFDERCNDAVSLEPVFYTNEISYQTLDQNNQFSSSKKLDFLEAPSSNLKKSMLNFNFSSTANEPFFKNRRNAYSSMWAFASLNYLYADLVGLMDKNKLLQYQTGVVEGLKITPEFLTIAAGFMQIPLANVFLPHVIKNEKTLRWVQIASGTIMTLVQSGTLFVGKPTPYYVLFSAFEIATTTFITIDAIRWKPNSQTKRIKID